MSQLIVVLGLFLSLPALALDPTGVWRFDSESCSSSSTPTPPFNPGTTTRYIIAGTSSATNGTMSVIGIWNTEKTECFFNDSGQWLLTNGVDMTFLSNGTSDSCTEDRYINPPFSFTLHSVSSTQMVIKWVISSATSVCPQGNTYYRTFNKEDLSAK